MAKGFLGLPRVELDGVDGGGVGNRGDLLLASVLLLTIREAGRLLGRSQLTNLDAKYVRLVVSGKREKYIC